MVVSWRVLAVVVVSVVSSQSLVAMEPRDVFAKASRSVVVVRTHTAAHADLALGSGVVVQPGFVATNCHVVRDASFISIGRGGAPVEAYLFAKDLARDICILVTSTDGLTVAEFADAKTVQTGARVYSIGAPLGLELTISEGLISGIRETRYGYVIQTSAAISHGSSGGGLFNDEGKLVGFTTFFFGNSQNLNFAIPARYALSSLAEAQRLRAEESATAAATAARFKERTAAATDVIKRSLNIASSDSPPFEPSFDTIDARLVYLHWRDELSRRLSKQVPERSIREELIGTVWYESKRAGLDTELVFGLIDAASGFRKYAISMSGARGYMQVASNWVTAAGETDASRLFHLQQNIRIGCVVLRHFLSLEGGNTREALVRFHGQMMGDQYRIEDKLTNAFVSEVFAARQRWTYVALSPVSGTVAKKPR